MRARKHTPPYASSLEARQKVALALEKRLLSIVKETPGLSAYDSGLKLHKPPATVHSAIKRMVLKGDVRARSILRKTGNVTLLYPNGHSFPDNTLVEIPRAVVRPKKSSWLSAFIYALNDESIGVSGEPVPEWEANCLWREEAKVDRESTGLLVRLPEKVASFYQIQKREVMQVFLNDKTLLTVIGTIQG